MSKPAAPPDRALLCTVTGEPFQPVRLYYAIPDRVAVTKVFKRLGCMDDDREAKCWVWLYEREAAKLTFGHPRESLDPRMHPIVIGRFTLDKDRMMLAVRSNERATQAARFFGPLFARGSCSSERGSSTASSMPRRPLAVWTSSTLCSTRT